MRILLADETNRKPGPKARFFVYGGLIFDVDDLPELDARVNEIREDAGYRPQDDLKFDTNTRPKHVGVKKATKAKQEVLSLCRDLGAEFIVYVALHDIIKRRDPDDQILFGVNTVISQFNKYLRDVCDDYGICVVDNLPVKRHWQYLSDKFTLGLQVGTQCHPLDRITLFAATCNNASHASSVTDIVVGTFRYCINDPANPKAASTMMEQVVELMWHEREGDTIHALERGLVMRPVPQHIRVEEYRAEYVALGEHINKLLADDDSSS